MKRHYRLEDELCPCLYYIFTRCNNRRCVSRRKFDEADIQQAFELLQVVGLAAFASQRANALSGSQRQHVGIARALMQQPALLLADKPTSR